MTKQHLAPFLWHNSLTSDKGENMCKDLLSPLHFLKYRHLCKVMSAQNSTKPTNNIIYQRWLHVKIHVPDITQNQDNPSECIHFALDVFVAIVGKPELSQTSCQETANRLFFDHVWNEAEFMVFSQNHRLEALLFTRLVLLLLCALVSLANVVLKLVCKPLIHFKHSAAIHYSEKHPSDISVTVSRTEAILCKTWF